MKRKKKKRIIISAIVILFILVLLAPLVLTICIYQSNFGSRYQTTSWMARSLDEFEDLNAQRYIFESNKGQKLTGYKYSKGTGEPKGIIIIAHGLGGGGHNSYMDIADYLASNGYIVFAYDATGNDESEGTSVVGLAQGVIDLDYAIRFVQNNDEFERLPVMLFGHSWGAYSSGSVLNVHPEVKAVVMVAGFNKSLDIIDEEGQRIMGNSFSFMLPYFSILERVKFGQYASYNCMDGFDTSKAGVMMLQSVDDDMISYQRQFKVFREKYENNPDFTFLSYDDRGHNYVYYSDAALQYHEKINSQFAEYVESTGSELSEELKTEYMDRNLDKTCFFELDTELMEQIILFYDHYANN